jgi:hypothetical protein
MKSNVVTKLVLAALTTLISLSAVAGIKCTAFYGANGKYVQKELLKRPIPYPCGNGTFGDPLPGVKKECYLGSNRVASEGGAFVVPPACPSGFPPKPKDEVSSVAVGSIEACNKIKAVIKREAELIIARVNGKEPLVNIGWAADAINKSLATAKNLHCK